MEQYKVYHISKHIRWTTEIHCVKVFDPDRQSTRTFLYPEAALWDLIQQGYPVHRMNEMISAIMKSNSNHVEKWMIPKINEWLTEELICTSDG